MNLLIIFILLSIVNVIFSTIKSIVTIKSGPWVASIVSALYYGYYNIVLIYTVADFPLWQKVVVTAGCNLVGVFIVKYGEVKARKDKLWKVEFAVPANYNADLVKLMVTDHDIPCNYFYAGKWTMFNCYCSTQEQTKAVKEIARTCDGKISAYESKNL